MKPMPQSGKVVAKIEWLTLYELDEWHFWLEMDGGGGMSVPKAEMMGLFSKIWKRF